MSSAERIGRELEMRGAWRSVRGKDESAGPIERLRSYRKVHDWGIADLRDPGPALSLAAGLVRRRTRKRAQRVLHRG